MSGAIATNVVLHDTALDSGPDQKHKLGEDAHAVEVPAYYEGTGVAQASYFGEDGPTDEELATLPRVHGHIKWQAYTIAFVELAERFSFYGTTVVYTNFVARPLNTPTGAAIDPNSQLSSQATAGALGMGSQAATGITTLNQFWCYIIPLLGAWVADTYLGRLKTIMYSVAIALIGHVILVASAAPNVLANHNSALAAFLIGLLIMGVGTGGFKPNISPLVAEQMDTKNFRVAERKGRKVIVDPALTVNRVYNYFYLFINIGALIGQIGMSYSAKYIGFWLAFLLPTIFFILCPVVLALCWKKYIQIPPQGSVLGPAMRIFTKAQKGRWSVNPVTTYKRMHDGTFWSDMKPTNYAAVHGSIPRWMTWDDLWVDEVRAGFHACTTFLYLPLYWLTYNQLNNNLVNQAFVMALNGVPNDVVSNLDPLALIILIPVFDLLIYPAMRKAGINFTTLKRITLGFLLGALSMIWAMVIQIYIYRQSDAGVYAYNGDNVSINVWAQTGAYVLIAVSEIFASIGSLEYAFSKAPKNMRSLVMSFSLFQSAFASAIGEAFNPLSGDPLLVWNYGVMAVLSLVGGILFWLQFRGLDKEEDVLNVLPSGHLGTATQAEEIERRRSVVSQAHADEKALDAKI